MRRAKVRRRGQPLLLALLTLPSAACDEQVVAPPVGLPITAAERALARVVFDMEVSRHSPVGPLPVAGSGLELAPLLEQSGQRALYLQALRPMPAATLSARVAGWTDTSRIYLLCALLDHPHLEVRLAALGGLSSLRDVRAVPALVATAKHNAAVPVEPEAAAIAIDYRRRLARLLQLLTGVEPYQGPAPAAGPGRAQIFAFDFGELERWLEREVLLKERWPAR